MKNLLTILFCFAAIRLKTTSSQFINCPIGISSLGIKCECDYSPCKESTTVFEYCIGSEKFNRSLYCSSKDETTLTLDKSCSGKAVRCTTIVSAVVNFPKFAGNNYASIFYSIKINNKNYKTVPDLSFNLLTIEQLDLAMNKIEVVENRSFVGLGGLRSLILSNNNIKDVIVNNMLDLEVLSLAKNAFTRIGKIIFSRLSKLKYLSLASNEINTIDKYAFNQTSDLQRLDLGGNKLTNVHFDLNLRKLVSLRLADNEIGELGSSNFANLTSLKVLMIENNKLVNLDPLAFSNLIQLRFLNLESNSLESVDLESLTSGLTNLMILSIYDNSVKSVKSNNTNGSCKQLSQLQELELNSNIINEIEPFSFSCFGSLASLDFSNQIMTTLPTPNIFFGLKSLTQLKLNDNSLTRIYNNTFIYLKTLNSLDLAANTIEYLDHDVFQGLFNLTKLTLYDNYLTKLTTYIFKSTTKLSVIDISRNKLTIIEKNSFSGLEKSLKTLKINTNRLQFLKNFYFQGLGELLSLNLRDNQISSIQRDTFKDLGKLTELIISDNSISSIDPNFFINLKNLDFLDLSSNVLVELRQGSFQHLKQLKVLNIGFNYLVKFNFQRVFSIESTILLEKVNLENNLISDLDMNWFIGLNRLAELNLNNNNFNMKIVAKKTNNTILPNLKYLSLRNVPIELIRQFNLSNLTSLDLSDCRLDQDIYQKIPFYTVQTLKLVQINGFNLSFLLLDYFDAFLKKNFIHVDVSFNRFDFDNFFLLIKKAFDLESLVLVNTGLTDKSLLLLETVNYPLLSRLDLSSNQISTLPALMFPELSIEMKKLDWQLVYFNASRNMIKRINKNFFLKTINLNVIDLSYNLFETFEDLTFLNLYKLSFLDLSYNRLKYLVQSMFSYNLLSKLVVVSLNDNQFMSKCEVIFNYPRIDSINLSGNNLTEIPSTIANNAKSVYLLDFGRNLLSIVKKIYFIKINSMKGLFLGRNQIEKIEEDAFATCKSLYTLDMSFNILSNLSTKSFTGLYDLQLLNLSHNRLELLQNGLLDPLRNLETVDFTNNSIKIVEESCFAHNRYLLKIYLAQNPLNKFFKNETFKGLDWIKYMELSEQVEINFDICLIIKSTVHVRFVKKVLNYIYFNSIDIITTDLSRPVYELDSYNESDCYQILYLSRNKKSLNLFSLEIVSKFVANCVDWIADAFINDELPLLFQN